MSREDQELLARIGSCAAQFLDERGVRIPHTISFDHPGMDGDASYWLLVKFDDSHGWLIPFTLGEARRAQWLQATVDQWLWIWMEDETHPMHPIQVGRKDSA